MAATKAKQISLEKEKNDSFVAGERVNADQYVDLSSSSSPSPDLQESRRMLRKKDLVHILFLYLCFAGVSPAYPCGEDPLRKLYSYAKATGQVPESVLSNIRFQDPPRYRFIVQGHKTYDECVIRVETGSFKRSPSDQTRHRGPMARLLDPQSLVLGENDSSLGSKRRPFYFLPKVIRRSRIYRGLRRYPHSKEHTFGRTVFPLSGKDSARMNGGQLIIPSFKVYHKQL